MGNYESLSKEELIKIVEKQEKELKSKKYGLVWDSEREPEQVVLDCENNLPILKRVKTKEIKTNDEADNILIEGDNYHALSVLNYTHKGKIDVIYIDPPYNLGKKDFIYNDRFVDKEDGYRHSKWLNFMEKRLKLAKELLHEKGVLFISIDDVEYANLKLLCDKIFQYENFITPIIWQSKTGSSDSKTIDTTTEYTLVYAKQKELVEFSFNTEGHQLKRYRNRDEYYHRRGPFYFDTLDRGGLSYSDSLNYPIECPDGTLSYPNGRLEYINDGWNWKWSKNKVSWGIENGFIEIKKTTEKVSGWTVYYKNYLFVNNEDNLIERSISHKNLITNIKTGEGAKLIKEMFGAQIFKYTKPVSYIKKLLSLIDVKNDISILDYFAGTGTTGHAVLEMNKEDGGKRKFILCTNNENNICEEVTYPRINKVINGYKYEGKTKTNLFEKKITWTDFSKKANEIKEEIEEIIEEHKDNFDKIEKKIEEGKINIVGIKDIKDKKEGLGGNLQYFKTGFVKKTKNRDQLKVNLTHQCTEMLCVKENIFNEEKAEEDYKIFSSNKKDKFLCIYYNFIDESFEQFIKEIKQIKEEKVIYMFSLDNTIDKDFFKGVKNYRIEPIPQNILDIYKQLVKMNKKKL